MNIAIVGGGIVGLALGYKLSKVKGNKVHVFEKEKEVYLSNDEILVAVQEMLAFKKSNELKKKKISNYNEYYKFFVLEIFTLISILYAFNRKLGYAAALFFIITYIVSIY